MGSFKRGAILGIATGYVLGSKAGRERYEQIQRVWSKVQESPVYGGLAQKAEAMVSFGIERGKVAVLDSVEKATGQAKRRAKQRSSEFEQEIRSVK